MRAGWMLVALGGCATSTPSPRALTDAEMGAVLERHLGPQLQTVVQAEPPDWAKVPGASGDLGGAIVGVGVIRLELAELGRSTAELRARAAIVTRLESLSLEVGGLDMKLATGVMWRSRTVALWWDGVDRWAAKVVLDDSGKFLGAIANDPELASWAVAHPDQLFARRRRCAVEATP